MGGSYLTWLAFCGFLWSMMRYAALSALQCHLLTSGLAFAEISNANAKQSQPLAITAISPSGCHCLKIQSHALWLAAQCLPHGQCIFVFLTEICMLQVCKSTSHLLSTATPQAGFEHARVFPRTRPELSERPEAGPEAGLKLKSLQSCLRSRCSEQPRARRLGSRRARACSLEALRFKLNFLKEC